MEFVLDYVYFNYWLFLTLKKKLYRIGGIETFGIVSPNTTILSGDVGIDGVNNYH